MGLLGFIGKRLYDVVALGRGIGNLALGIGKKVVEGGKFIGKAFKFVFGKKAPMIPVREGIREAGTATRMSQIPTARVIQEVKGVIPPGQPGIPSYAGFGAQGSVVPRMTISAPISRTQPILAPSTAGFKDFSKASKSTISQLSKDVYTAGSKGQLRNVIQDRGYYYGNPKRAELFRGVLTPATDISRAKSLPLGNVTQRGLGGFTKAQRTSNEINRLGELGRGRIGGGLQAIF
jgi:hypothetical protein